ncbi:MAG: HPr(Ser) kinase/phosphatase [Christensenellaceae bacterium]|nr:HPr(Ser) kinase/phosphatase [Christensenellaceae bacterium]MBR3843469.1 HPr(Ser) kinase/phosphatase [Christensenellaceae bacterium]
MHNVNVNRLADQLDLSILYMGERDSMKLYTSNVHRPGLALTGFYKNFSSQRMQIFGKAELAYLYSLPKEELVRQLESYFSHDIPCAVIAWNLRPPKEFMELAEKHDIPVLSSNLTTEKLGHAATLFLDNELAPCIVRHGGLLDVSGVGIFVTGDSGVGKSEAALELIQHGHRMVADDVVEIRKINEETLLGSSPDVVKHMMEIRGLGLIDISVLYGMGAVMENKTIRLCIHLELGDSKGIDRLGMAENYIELMGVKIPKITIPVRPGRNISRIIEVAAMNFRLKRLGHNPADLLDQKLLNLLG